MRFWLSRSFGQLLTFTPPLPWRSLGSDKRWWGHSVVGAAIRKAQGSGSKHLYENYVPIPESSLKLTLLHKWNDYWHIVVISLQLFDEVFQCTNFTASLEWDFFSVLHLRYGRNTGRIHFILSPHHSTSGTQERRPLSKLP